MKIIWIAFKYVIYYRIYKPFA